MQKPFDSRLPYMSKNQLLVLKYLLSVGDALVTHRDIAKRTSIVEKQLGGVLSSLARRTIDGMTLLVPMGKSERGDLRWQLNVKAITAVVAEKQLRSLLATYGK